MRCLVWNPCINFGASTSANTPASFAASCSGRDHIEQHSKQRSCLRPRSRSHPDTSASLNHSCQSPVLARKPAQRVLSASAVASSRRPSPPAKAEYYYRETSAWPTADDTLLQTHDLEAVPYVDLIVAGAGPAGIAVAERVAGAGFTVCVLDATPLSIWPNNYGAWVDEFTAMGLEDCLEVVWPKARVWLDSGSQGERSLDRPYGRVDRPKLKRKLLDRSIANGVTFLYSKAEGVSHADGSSTVTLSDGRSIRGSLVLDATGHARKLVNYDQRFDPGFQGAYGIIAEVESHPFPLDTMLFMDWRDDHTAGDAAMQASNSALPTFLYAMPFTPTKVFLEETSLVARPAIGFDDLKARLEARLKWLNIKVTKVEEEEYCLIPMGGVLPQHPQRVLAMGGTAGMVHPSTGFMIARMLGAAPTVADAIVEQLSRPTDRANSNGTARRPSSEAEAQAMATAVWAATWPLERIRQRAFFTFGMDVLLQLDLPQIREFFAAFFSLSAFHWHGFLSTRLSFTELIGFGLSLFINASNSARANLLVKGVPGLVVMLAGLVPTLRPDYYGIKSLRSTKSEVDAVAKAAAQAAKAVPVAATQPPVSSQGNGVV